MRMMAAAPLALCLACHPGSVPADGGPAPRAASAPSADAVRALVGSCWQVEGGRALQGAAFWSAPLRLDSLPADNEGYLRMTPLAALPQGPADADQVHASWTVWEGALVLRTSYGFYATTVELEVSGDAARGRLRHFYDVVDDRPNRGVEVTARRVSCERGG